MQLRKRLYANNGGSGDLALSFSAPLRSSLAATLARGSPTPTFTRATTAYVWGYAADADITADSPILLAVASGEARFVGARRVSEGVWSAVDANGVALTTTNGASALYGDATGPFGYLAEGARTNVLLQSQTLDTTWTISNAADMNAVAADAYTAPDGTATMDKLQPKATTAVHSLDQAFTFTAAVYTTSIYLRYVTATPQRWVALVMNDGTTTWAASFDLLNGVAGAVLNCTSTITATGIANVYRVTVTKSAAAAAAAGTVKISLNATDTATLESAARAGTETLGAWGAQLEAATFASTYIPTTTIAVARNADVLVYANSGNIGQIAGSAYAEVKSAGYAGNPGVVAVSGISAPLIFAALGPAQAEPRVFDSTTFATSGLGNKGLVSVKVGSSWGGAGMKAFADGVAGNAQSFDGSIGTAAIVIGLRQDTGSEAIFGTVRNVRLYNRALSDAALQAMTA